MRNIRTYVQFGFAELKGREMKREKLKNKIYSFKELEEWIKETSEENYDKNTRLKILFRKEDVKSAIELLKKEIKQADKDYCDGKLSNYYYELIKKIDEVFPDLYPLEKRRT